MKAPASTIIADKVSRPPMMKVGDDFSDDGSRELVSVVIVRRRFDAEYMMMICVSESSRSGENVPYLSLMYSKGARSILP